MFCIFFSFYEILKLTSLIVCLISDGDRLGGCKPGAGTDCFNSSLSCVTTSGTRLHGTCILSTGQVPGGFGNGECRTGQIIISRISIFNKYAAGI